jgi:hypothetical protein
MARELHKAARDTGEDEATHHGLMKMTPAMGTRHPRPRSSITVGFTRYLAISCRSRRDELRSTTFHEPPHDIRHRHAGPAGDIRPVATATASPSRATHPWQVSN